MNDYLNLYNIIQNNIKDVIRDSHGNSKLCVLREMSGNDIKKILPVALMKLMQFTERGNNTMVAVTRGISGGVALLPTCPALVNIKEQIIIGSEPLNILAKHGAVYMTKRYTKANAKHKTNCIAIGDVDMINGLFEIALSKWDLQTKTGILPSFDKYDDWKSVIHNNGVKLVRKGDRGYINDNIQWNHFNLLNVKQSVGWRINTDMLRLYKKFKSNKNNVSLVNGDGKIEKSAFTWHTEIDKASKKGKKLLVNNTINIATLVEGNTFYHQYTYDFRGRTYPNTALLHEQGDDTARGLLEFADKEPLGDDGYMWILFSASSHYGYDKATRLDRIKFAKDNLLEWIDYGNNPLYNKGWIEADKPLQFLRTCIELAEISKWLDAGNETKDWFSGYVCSIDATTSGAQIMAALTNDSKLGAEVNLTKSNVRGDLYKVMADATFGSIKADNPTGDNITIRDWWLSRDDKQRRHSTKRITMTTYYSAKPWGLVEQIMEDVDLEVPDYITDEDEIRAFKIVKANYFIKHFLSVQDSGVSKTPYRVMEMLKLSCMQGDIEWKSPMFNFPNKQKYVKPHKGRAVIYWLKQRVDISYDDYGRQGLAPDIEKHRSGVVANFVHSIDAAHVAALTERACIRNYTCSSVHDSYLCKANSMTLMWKDVRETFVDVLSREDRFNRVGDGLLTLSDVTANEFAFS